DLGPGTRARVARESWSTPRDLGHGCEWSGRDGHPGVLVVPAGHRTLARVAQDSASTPRNVASVREMPRRAGRHCGPTEKSASRPGERVETACLQSKAQGGKDSWSSPRALEPGPGSPGISGR
ncbi:hypothetical protein C0984_19620, partial [Clostridioides difficile]